jgi:hypothetical protein
MISIISQDTSWEYIMLHISELIPTLWFFPDKPQKVPPPLGTHSPNALSVDELPRSAMMNVDKFYLASIS